MTTPTVPTPEAVERFCHGEASTAETRSVVQHLLVTGAASAGSEPASDDYDAGLDRVVGRLGARRDEIDAARDAARAVRESLDAMPTDALAGAVDRLAAEAEPIDLAIQLIAAVQEAVAADPGRAEILARTAVGLAEAASDAPDTPGVRADVAADAWAHLGNALRVANDLPDAARAFGRAAAWLADGTGDPGVEARLANLRGVLHNDQRSFRAACADYRRARRLARRIGDLHLAGRAALNEATTLAAMGATEDAVRLLERATEWVDTEVEPRLALVMAHNLVAYLDRAGRPAEAAERFESLRALAAEVGGPLDRLRLDWLEGRIALHAGDRARGKRCLERALRGFGERDLRYDCALITLELAAVFLEAGATADVKRLALSLVPVFEAQDVHREAQAALRVFCQAAEAEQAGLALIDEVRSFLERARWQPDLRFRSSSAG